MKKYIKRILSAFTACAIMTSMFAAVRVQAVEDNDILTPEIGAEDELVKTYTEMCTGTKDEYSYSVWKDPDSGKASFTPYDKGCFDCSWNDTEDPIFNMGKTDECGIVCIYSNNSMGYYCDYEYVEMNDVGSRELKIGYEADISAEGGFFFGASCKYFSPSGDSVIPDGMLLVGEAYSGMDFLENANLVSSFTLNGVDYDVYDGAVTVRDIENYDRYLFPKSVPVYWVMRRESLDISDTVKGTADLDGIIENLNRLHAVRGCISAFSEPSLCVRGFGKSGSVKVTKNDITIENYPDEEKLGNGEEITRGEAVWSVDMNENTSGTAAVLSGGSLRYKWDKADDDAHCLIKSRADISGLSSSRGLSYIYLSSSFKFDYENEKPDRYAFGLWGTIGTPNVEFYILDSCSSPDILKNAELVDSVSTIEDNFDVYREYTDIDTEYGKVVRFFSVFKDKPTEKLYNSEFGYNLKNHTTMWRAHGLKAEDILDVGSFAEISGSNSGCLYLKIPYVHCEYDQNITYRYEVSDYNFMEKDLEELQLYLLGDDYLPANKNFDINEDGVIDVYDLIKLRKLMVRMQEGLPWSIDPYVSDNSVVSNKTDSYSDWSWGKSYYDEGLIEAVANENSLTGQWEDSDSAYFFGSAGKNLLYSTGEPLRIRYIKYNYTAGGSGSFMVGAFISVSDQRTPVLSTKNIYIAESYNDFAYLDKVMANGDAAALGIMTLPDGTEYEVIRKIGSAGMEIFLFRTARMALANNNTGVICYDDILEQLKELVPDIYGKYITVSFGSKCFENSRGYLKCSAIITGTEDYD